MKLLLPIVCALTPCLAAIAAVEPGSYVIDWNQGRCRIEAGTASGAGGNISATAGCGNRSA